MYRQNLLKFGVQIRRQRKLSLFKNLRRQHQNIQQIQRNIHQLLSLKVCKQNYTSIRNILREVIQKMVSICSKASYKSVYYQGQKSQIQMNGSLPIQKLLVSPNFKLYLLDTFSSINQSQIKSSLNSFSLQNQLAKQMVILIGLLLKQPFFLQSYFPLMIFKNINQNNQNQMLLNKCQQNINSEQGIYLQFQVLQQLIFYIKQKFTTINQILSDSKTFLTLLHSITRVLQHFTLNSKVQKANNKNMVFSQNDDTQYLNFMYQILKSNNFQHYLKQLILDIEENQNQKNNYPTKLASDLILDKELEQNVINLGICQIFGVYMDFINKVLPNNEYSHVFTNTLLRFSQRCLKIVHQFNSQRYVQGIPSESLLNQSQDDTNNNKELRQVCLWTLFSLQRMMSSSKIQPSSNIINKICMQIMIFLHNIRQNEGLKHRKDLKLSYQNQYHQNKDNQSKDLKDKISSVQYYFDILVCEQQNVWFSELQLLGCLFNLVFKYNVSLEQLFTFSLEYKSNQMQTTTILINTKLVQSFFETVGEEILILSGTFYNQRHLFMCTLVHLFCHWYECMQIYQNRKRKKHQFDQQFTLQFMSNLGQTVLNYLGQLKSTVTQNNQLLQISTYHDDTVRQQQTVLGHNMSILQCLTIIEEQLLDLLQRSSKNDIEIQI